MTAPTRVVVSGATGRMGQTLARLIAADPALEAVGGVARDAPADGAGGFAVLRAPAEAAPLLRDADVLIDFSAPAFLHSLLEASGDALAGVAIVVGTTGLDAAQLRTLSAAAERSPVLIAANFSPGVNLLLALAERAARSLGPDFDIEIVEAHHRRKEDAPSGTALALGEAVAAGREVDLAQVRRDGRTGRPGPRPDGEIGFHSLRGGEVVGEHHVHFLGALERIELSHTATDRAIFAAGALRATKWLVGRAPSTYSMRDVLGL